MDTTTNFVDIDFQSPMLSERDAELMRALARRRQRYIEQGRGREAHGVGSAIAIVWQSVSQPDIPIDVPDTRHGGLD
jgi:hypothetical protein